MEEIEMNILKSIHEFVGTGGSYASHDKIAQSLKIADQDILDLLDMLEIQGYVSLARSIDGAGARLTAPGRLLLTHPEYMFNKGYGDASDVLKALEKVLNDSDSIPQSEKEPLLEKLKYLYHDPYVQNISSGFILEALKKLSGI